MEAPQPTESFGAYPRTFQVGQNDAASISDDDIFHVSAPVDKHADLSVYLTRDFGQVSSEFLSYDLVGTDTPLVKFLKTVDLALLQTLQVTLNIYGCLLRANFARPWQLFYIKKGTVARHSEWESWEHGGFGGSLR
jgi:hypothetical protein